MPRAKSLEEHTPPMAVCFRQADQAQMLWGSDQELGTGQANDIMDV